MRRRPLPWALRLLWLVLPLTSGPALGAALDAASRPVQLAAATGLWAGWAAGLLATLVAHPLSLTAVRVAAPAGLAAAVAAAAAGHADAAALGSTALATVVSLAPAIGEHCADGAAYGDERRLPLRVPGVLLLGPLFLAWALAVAGLAAGPLLLAARQWVAGAVALAVGLPLAAVCLRSLHGLSRRWLVFVPAGLVLHDPMTLADPVLFQRSSVRRLGPAPAGSDALDLTQRAFGLALELELDGPVSLTLVRPGRREAQTVEVDRLLVTPTRPGHVMEEARRRRFPASPKSGRSGAS